MGLRAGWGVAGVTSNLFRNHPLPLHTSPSAPAAPPAGTAPGQAGTWGTDFFLGAMGTCSGAATAKREARALPRCKMMTVES
jgi:hypothetical protein